MLMGLHDILAAVVDPEEREAVRQDFLRRMDERRKMRGEVDTSDIPEVTDFSRFMPGKPYVDKIREHNLKVWAERAERQRLEEPILTK